MNIISCIINKFKFAFEGLFFGLRHDRSIKIQFSFGFLAIIIGMVLKISRSDWIVIIIAISLVIVAEFFNSAIETLADVVCNEENIHIKRVKDLAAAGVLVAAITALILGLIVFKNYFI